MKKQFLITLPLVAMLAACGGSGAVPGPREDPTKVDLPEGGEKIDPKDESKADDYSRASESFFRGLVTTIENDVIEVNTTFNVSVKNVPIAESANASIEGSGEIDVFLAMPTEEEYTKAEIDVKNVNFTISGIDGKNVSITNLNLSAYYEVTTKDEEVGEQAYLLVDITDPSIRRNVYNILSTFTTLELTEAQFEGLFAYIFGSGKLYYSVNSLIDMLKEQAIDSGLVPLSLPDDDEEEPVVPVEELPVDVIGDYINLARGYLSTILSYIPMIISSIEFQPELTVYKDESGKIEEVGFAISDDYTEFVNESAKNYGGEHVEEDVLKSFRAGAAVLVGNKNGSKSFGLESVKAKVNAEVINGVNVKGEVEASVKYNESVSKTVGLSQSEIDGFDKDFNEVIEMIQAIIDMMNQQPEVEE